MKILLHDKEYHSAYNISIKPLFSYAFLWNSALSLDLEKTSSTKKQGTDKVD